MKKSTTIFALALTMLAAYAILNLVSISRQVRDAAEQSECLRAEIEAAQAENELLNDALEALDDGSGLEKEAEVRLRLIRGDAAVFADKD